MLGLSPNKTHILKLKEREREAAVLDEISGISQHSVAKFKLCIQGVRCVLMVLFARESAPRVFACERTSHM